MKSMRDYLGLKPVKGIPSIHNIVQFESNNVNYWVEHIWWTNIISYDLNK
jgi:hypothetical protein